MAIPSKWIAGGLVRFSLTLSAVAAAVPPSAPGGLGLLAGAFATFLCVVAATVGLENRSPIIVANQPVFDGE